MGAERIWCARHNSPWLWGYLCQQLRNNGLLPLQLEDSQIAEIARWVGMEPAYNTVVIDLPAQRVEAGGWVYDFEIEPGAKRMLVEGLDAIAVTQARWQEIQAFHQQRQALRPWLY